MTIFRSTLVGVAALVAMGLALPVLAQDTLPEPVPAPSPRPAAAQKPAADLSIALDMAALTRVPSQTTTLVLGNPAIADATIQRNGLIVVTGKSYGTTNLMALDREGQTLSEMMIHVSAPTSRTLTVLRGTSRETYSCSPRCEQTVTPGDNPEYFGAYSGQVGSRNGMATQR
jgi:Flp pilus assembly secretin CpaC